MVTREDLGLKDEIELLRRVMKKVRDMIADN